MFEDYLIKMQDEIRKRLESEAITLDDSSTILVSTIECKNNPANSHGMENIELTFTGEGQVVVIDPPVLVLSIDETGKHVPTDAPKRVEKAFTRAAIDKILSLDEIPYKNGYGAILDGNTYHITIKKGNAVKEYFANDLSIETYPLLRYLASWYSRWL